MSLVLTAFLMGLFGLVHCVTMCGSLSMALGFSIPNNKSFLLYSSLISIGRIFGYAIIGTAVNALSQGVISLTDGGVIWLSIVANALMLGIGLHIANFSNKVLLIENIGRFFNPLLAPLKNRILPIDSVAKCLLYGLVWGFLPCGLVYTALTLALTAPSPMVGGATMLAFGVATLPALIGMTAVNGKLANVLKAKKVRVFFGIFIIIMAILQLHTSVLKLSGI